jgi:PAS domain-containing protein
MIRGNLRRSCVRERHKSAENIVLLDTLYSKSPVGLGFVDRKFRIVRIDEALASINGASVEEHIGQRVADVVPKLWPQIESLYRSVLESCLPIANREVIGEVPPKPGETHHWLAN